MARNWFEKKLTGHFSFGRLTVYGSNAMHWGVTIRTKTWGYICFRLPLRCFGYWWPLYFYLSPNATPWAATFYRGTDRFERGEKYKAQIRFQRFGHNFNTDTHFDELCKINGQ